jgi:hypothetical protein
VREEVYCNFRQAAAGEIIVVNRGTIQMLKVGVAGMIFGRRFDQCKG